MPAKKPKTSKPSWALKLVPSALIITFIICIAVCAIDGLNIIRVNNVDKFWDVLLILLAGYIGLVSGSNLSK